jgi:hypothetical protein
MIKGLMGSNGVVVSGGNTSLQYVNQNVSNPMQGMIRVWGTDMQVFDGSNWQNMQTSYATVELDAETRFLLQWIRDKKKEEAEIEAFSKNHPAIKIALENLNKAEQQLKATVILSKEYENNEATAS